MKMNIEGVNVNKIITYYVQGHTGKGYVNYIQKNLQGINRIVLLESRLSVIVTAVLNELISDLADKEVEVIKSIESKILIEGVIVREMSLAILNKRIYDGPKEKITKTVQIDNKISYPVIPAYKQAVTNNEKAYQCFAKGLKIHEQLEKVYIGEMNFNKADQIIEKLKSDIFSNEKPKKSESIVYERLFGTNTPDGIVNTVPSLIEPLQHKVFILGRAGTGKSYLMNKVVEQCLKLGIDVELYRCSLDPNSIDMVIIRELSVCIHDNTSPHIISMHYENQQIIDMYKETVKQTTEKDNEEKINQLQHLYKKEMTRGLRYLQEHEVDTDSIFKKIKKENFSHIIKKIL